jgi:pimeloyl-ACP methyl ester carboxylesterase
VAHSNSEENTMAGKKTDLISADFFVPHRSRVKANAGQLVGLHVRQRVLASAAKAHGGIGRGRVVLFVHGGNVPVVPAFDLDYKDYSWMAYLARAGFNVYGLDLSGYGSSPRPMMDDPANVDAEGQPLLIPRQLKAATKPNYPFQSHTIRSDWAEIDTVVDYLRRVNRVKRISLVGWSAGGPRVGGYVSQHPDKAERVVLFAPSEPDPKLKDIPAEPGPGAPTKIQSRQDLEQKRWDPNIGRPDQVAPGVRDAVWKEISAWDPIGSSWGPAGKGGVMRSPNRTRSGWTVAMARKVTTPMLIITGTLDRPAARQRAYDHLTVRDKAFVLVESASHFMTWEKQRHVLHAASLEWLGHGRINGKRGGRFAVDWNGYYSAITIKD